MIYDIKYLVNIYNIYIMVYIYIYIYIQIDRKIDRYIDIYTDIDIYMLQIFKYLGEIKTKIYDLKFHITTIFR